MTDIEYMQRALDLARKGIGKTSPNPAVGCVIVKDDKIVGEGWHKKCGGSHAEIFALKQAKEKAQDATMYVTLEPCSFQGKTPPCVDAVISAGLKRVVIAMKDPNPKVSGRSVRKMRAAGIEVHSGLLQQQAREINQPFVKWITSRIPLVTIKTAQTLDGKIAAVTGRSKWITSEAARKYTRRMRNGFDAILVGINTVLQDDPRLEPVLKTKPWTKVVLDSTLKIALNARILKTFKTIVFTTTKAPAAKIKQLRAKGIEVVVCSAAEEGRISFKTLLKELGKREITNVLIEGGARVIGNALKEHAVDRILTVIAPKILGDQQALSAVDGLNIVNVNKAVRIDVEKVHEAGGDWIFEGKVLYQ